MKLRPELPKSYGIGRKFSELAIKYATLIDVLTTETERDRIESIGKSICHYNILKTGIEVGEKEKDTVSRQILLESLGISDSKMEDEKEKIRTNIKLVIEELELLESSPRIQKTLAEISRENVTTDNLEDYLKRAKKDGIVEELDGKYQLSEKGLEVACKRINLKDLHV